MPSGEGTNSTTTSAAQQEHDHLLSVLASFEAYLPYTLASNNLRRRSLNALPRAHRRLLNSLGPEIQGPQLSGSRSNDGAASSSQSAVHTHSAASNSSNSHPPHLPPRGVKTRIDEIDDRIRRNASFLEEIVSEARGFLGDVYTAAQEREQQSSSSSSSSASSPSSNKRTRLGNGVGSKRGQTNTSLHEAGDVDLISTSRPSDPPPQDRTFQAAAEREDVAGNDDHRQRGQRKHHPVDPPKDLDKVRSTLKQFVRDWSSAGAQEREHAYGPILSTLDHLFGSIPFPHRRSIKLLFPGCGLGRLPWEAAMRGFSSQGNEFSFFMLLASHLVLNKTTSVEEHTIYPWVHTMSNWRASSDVLQEIRIPDVDPNALTALMGSFSQEYADNTSRQHQPQPQSLGPDFSMVAGDFLSVYSSPSEKAQWSAVCTVFFLDTAKNAISYLATLNHLLPIGGYWINLGPLLWHFEGQGPETKYGESSSEDENTHHSHGEGRNGHSHSHSHSHSRDRDGHNAKNKIVTEGSIELTLEEVKDLIHKMGFQIETSQTLPRQSYTGHTASMLTYGYECEFWCAKKVTDWDESMIL